MNQIICDACGSKYPETDERCPVCGFARQGNEKVVAASAAEPVAVKVKGGRFSSKNVKKRQKAQLAAQDRQTNPNKPLWIIIALLLVAIVLVTAYIGIRFFRNRDSLQGILPGPETTAAPTQTTQPPTVPCVALSLDNAVVALDEVGQTHQLGLQCTPEGTTDALLFVSSDPAVATVSEDGLVTAVGSGQAIITITCGEVVRECDIICWFQQETTMPATQPVETAAPTEAPAPTEAAVLTLDLTDVSCFARNEVFNLYANLGEQSVGRSKITWTSSDPKVAKVEKGQVTAVGKGIATITAEYQGQKATCVVRCRFEDAEPTEETQEQEDQGSQTASDWKASHTDVSISVGETFRLKVTDSAGNTAKAIWTMDLDGIVSIDGRSVTGRTPGTVTLTTTVDGVTMTCIVRVK